MGLTLHCDGCGQRWYPERDGIWPDENHGHTPWGLLAIPVAEVLITLLLVLKYL